MTIDPAPLDTETQQTPDAADDDGDAAPEADDSLLAGSDALLSGETQIAATDAAARSGVAPDEVLVTDTELVTWPNGAVGCPEPGMMYTQALVDSYRITVEADGEQYVYHGQSDQAPFYCAQPQEPASVG